MELRTARRTCFTMELRTIHRKFASLTWHEGNWQCDAGVLCETQQWSHNHDAACIVWAAAQTTWEVEHCKMLLLCCLCPAEVRYLFLALIAITQQQGGPYARLELQHCLLSTSSIQGKQCLQTKQDKDELQHCIAPQLKTSNAATAVSYMASCAVCLHPAKRSVTCRCRPTCNCLHLVLCSAASLSQVWWAIDEAVSKRQLYYTLLHDHCCMAFAETIQKPSGMQAAKSKSEKQ